MIFPPSFPLFFSSCKLLLLKFLETLCVYKGSERHSQDLHGTEIILLLLRARFKSWLRWTALTGYWTDKWQIFTIPDPTHLIVPAFFLPPEFSLRVRIIAPRFPKTILISNVGACVFAFDLENSITISMLQPHWNSLHLLMFLESQAVFLSLESISKSCSTETPNKQSSLLSSTCPHTHTHTQNKVLEIKPFLQCCSDIFHLIGPHFI